MSKYLNVVVASSCTSSFCNEQRIHYKQEMHLAFRTSKHNNHGPKSENPKSSTCKRTCKSRVKSYGATTTREETLASSVDQKATQQLGAWR